MVKCKYNKDSVKCAQCTKDSHGCYKDGVSRMGGVKGARGGIKVASKSSKGKESVATPVASACQMSSEWHCVLSCS